MLSVIMLRVFRLGVYEVLVVYYALLRCVMQIDAKLSVIRLLSLSRVSLG